MSKLVKVLTKEQMSEVSDLAREIWVEHYTPITGIDQIEYMLHKYLSVEAISSQIDEGYEFYTISNDGKTAGFMSILPKLSEKSVMLSKLYTHKSVRGKGLGKKMLSLAEEKSREKDCKTLYLTVNKNNSKSIAWYEKMGFIKTDAMVTDIGNGFVMDDYKMEKNV